MCMRRISYLMIVLTAGVFIACSDDDGPKLEEKIDIDDADLVSNSIVIEKAIKNEGNPPAPSTDPNAPSLYEESEDDFGAVAGQSFYLDPKVNEGQPAGIYFQIKGSNEYFDVPLTSGSSGGRFGTRKSNSRLFRHARTAENDVIEIQIPDNLEPGEFCALYCIYDEEGRVSNVVEICIEIIEFGGEGSDFFSAQTWEMVSVSNTEDGVTEIEVPGEDYFDDMVTSVLCEGDQYQTITVTETYRTNHFYVTFSDNGAYKFEAEYFEKVFDWENSTCTDVKLKERTEIEEETGVWTYDDTSKTLTVVTEYVDDYDGQTYTDILKFNIELVNDQLVLSKDDDDDDEEFDKIVLKKKS